MTASQSNLPKPVHRLPGSAALLLCALMLGGCASVSQPHPQDPLESFNRGVYGFNDGVDRAVLKPVAQAYVAVTPSPVRTGVGNFFSNLGDIWTFVNSVLQFKGQAAAETAMRFSVNSTLGLAGLLDIATEAGIPKYSEDFGQTLGFWGVPAGPYLVLPLLGPSTVRDTAALPVDAQGNAVTQGVDHIPTRNSFTALDLVNTRAELLRAGRLVDEAALDRYSFTRDVFLQRRQSQVYDGDPPDLVEPDAAKPNKP